MCEGERGTGEKKQRKKEKSGKQGNYSETSIFMTNLEFSSLYGEFHMVPKPAERVKVEIPL